MFIANWSLGTHRQVLALNQVTQASQSPPAVTKGSLLSLHGPWLLLSTFASAEWKGQLQSQSPHQQAQKMDLFGFPFRYRGWVPGGGGEASPGHLRRLSITWSAQRYAPTTTTQHSWEVLQTPTAASPWSCVHANKCSLKHGMALLPSVPELGQVGVSSRASEPRAGCYRDMPRECFRRAGTAHSASSWGICAT